MATVVARPREETAPGEIAVVVTCLDAGRLLTEALASVRAQTRPASEIVVVDSGSTDPVTLELLRRCEAEGVAILRAPGETRASARNRGIARTTAAYVVVLEADDALAPCYLDKTAERLDRDPALDFITSGVEAFGEARYRWTPPACTLVDFLGQGTVHASTTFRRRLWEEVGGFDAAFAVCLDVDFWVSALERGARGEVLDEPLFRYRVRRDSVYRRALADGTCRAEMQGILRKHRPSVEALGPELLLAREAFLGNQRAHRHGLKQRARSLEKEIAAVDAEIADIGRELASTSGEGPHLGVLRRLTPLSDVWGLDRGGPLDRYYIERFLARHRPDVCGRVLEVKDPGYTRMFGDDRVSREDVVDIDPGNPRATIVADLARADAIPSDTFDCFILTQTLQFIYDARAVLRHACRILKPGGVLLCTAPAVSRISYEDRGLDGDYWRFTAASLRELFAETFRPGTFEVTSYGNVLACAAFLYGLAPQELTPAELDHHDPYFPLVFGVRAVKADVTH